MNNLSQYKSNPKRKYPYNKYSDHFKLTCVLDYLENKLTYKEIIKKHNVGGKTTIHNWVREFKKGKFDGVQTIPMTYKNQRILALENKLTTIKRELKQTKVEMLAYKKMLEITERNFNIKIKKKYGSKQSES